MSVYNGERYLAEALDSLLGQTLEDFELVVVDDASTDGTAGLLRSYAERDDRIVLLRNAENARLPASLNRGLERCRAPLVARADADDVYRPDRLARQVQFMTAHPDVGLLSSAYTIVRPDGSRRLHVHPLKDEEIRMRDLFVNSFLHPGVMFRADLVRSAGGYDEALWTAQDTELWNRLRRVTRVANLPEPLVDYRIHDSQTTQERGKEGARISMHVRRRVLGDYLGRLVGEDEARAAVSLYMGYTMSRAEVRNGLAVLREVARVACSGPRSEARCHRRAVGVALVRQAARQLTAHGDWVFAALLLGQAAAWSPRALGSSFVRERFRERVLGLAPRGR